MQEAVAFTFAVMVHVAVAWRVIAPIIQGDESGYLLKAAALAGYRTEGFSSYYPGYSLFITWPFVISHDPVLIYKLVQVTNAILWGLACAIAGNTYNLIFNGSAHSWSRSSWIALAVIVVYPAFLTFSPLAFSENAFIFAVVAVGYSVLSAAIHRQEWRLYVAIVFGCLAALVHPLGIVVLAALLLALLIEWRRYTWSCKLPLATVGLIAAYITARWYLRQHLAIALDADAVGTVKHYPSITKIIESIKGLSTISTLKAAAISASGQFIYLMAATGGLWLIGFLWSVRGVVKRDAELNRLYTTFALLAVVLTYAVAVWFLMNGDRADHRIYGRYNEGVLILLLIPGLGSVLKIRHAYVGVVLIGVALLFYSLAYGWSIPGSYVLTNISGVAALVQPFHRVYPALICVYGAFALLLASSFGKRIVWRNGVIAILFLAQAVFMFHLYMYPGSEGRSRQHELADYIKKVFPSTTCVNYDARNPPFWERFNDEFFLIPMRKHFVTAPFSHMCSHLLISANSDISKYFPFAVAVKQETNSANVLWVIRAKHSSLLSAIGADLEFGRTYKPFLDTNNFERLLGTGWHGIENWGVWSDGDGVMLIRSNQSDIAGSDLVLKYFVYGASAARPISVTIAVNGETVVTQRVDTAKDLSARFALTTNLPIEGGARLAVVRITSSPVYSPRGLGQSGDSRALGVGLLSVELVHHHE
jgi:hypothetical protein